jgi:hypothetical protein
MEVPDQSGNDPKSGLVEVIEVIEIMELEEHAKRHGTHTLHAKHMERDPLRFLLTDILFQ